MFFLKYIKDNNKLTITVKKQGECDTPPDAAEDAKEEITEKGGEPVDNDICGET